MGVRRTTSVIRSALILYSRGAFWSFFLWTLHGQPMDSQTAFFFYFVFCALLIWFGKGLGDTERAGALFSTLCILLVLSSFSLHIFTLFVDPAAFFVPILWSWSLGHVGIPLVDRHDRWECVLCGKQKEEMGRSTRLFFFSRRLSTPSLGLEAEKVEREGEAPSGLVCRA